MSLAHTSFTLSPTPVNNILRGHSVPIIARNVRDSDSDSEFCRKYKLIIPRVSRWFPVQFYMYIKDLLSLLLYGWSAEEEHLAKSGRNVV